MVFIQRRQWKCGSNVRAGHLVLHTFSKSAFPRVVRWIQVSHGVLSEYKGARTAVRHYKQTKWLRTCNRQSAVTQLFPSRSSSQQERVVDCSAWARTT